MQHWPETNESLILRVKDPADAAAWSDFIAIYRPVVVRMAFGRGLQHADADDLAQQVFLSVARAIEHWEADSQQPPFRAWLSRISRNAIVNALTRKKPDAAGGSTSAQEMLRELPERDDETTQQV
ncbi:MAG TPA: sigma-70 family RNA polymerase sigma factor, partial [Planctomycetaceae bacterium]|nr:sigma-70 family RNA polymerase sigma factor [Planctomycetaceae bacterium]